MYGKRFSNWMSLLIVCISMILGILITVNGILAADVVISSIDMTFGIMFIIVSFIILFFRVSGSEHRTEMPFILGSLFSLYVIFGSLFSFNELLSIDFTYVMTIITFSIAFILFVSLIVLDYFKLYRLLFAIGLILVNSCLLFLISFIVFVFVNANAEPNFGFLIGISVLSFVMFIFMLCLLLFNYVKVDEKKWQKT